MSPGDVLRVLPTLMAAPRGSQLHAMTPLCPYPKLKAVSLQRGKEYFYTSSISTSPGCCPHVWGCGASVCGVALWVCGAAEWAHRACVEAGWARVGYVRWVHVGCEAHAGVPSHGGKLPHSRGLPLRAFSALASRQSTSPVDLTPTAEKKTTATVCKAQPFPSGIISISAPSLLGHPKKRPK